MFTFTRNHWTLNSRIWSPLSSLRIRLICTVLSQCLIFFVSPQVHTTLNNSVKQFLSVISRVSTLSGLLPQLHAFQSANISSFSISASSSSKRSFQRTLRNVSFFIRYVRRKLYIYLIGEFRLTLFGRKLVMRSGPLRLGPTHLRLYGLPGLAIYD